MKDPVKAHDKLVYEKQAIATYLEKHNKSPKTGKPLNPRIPVESSLKPQIALKKEIESFMEGNKELLEMQEEGDTSKGETKGETGGEENICME